MHPQHPLHLKKTEEGKVVLLTCVSFLPPPQEKQINSRALGQFFSIHTLQKFHGSVTYPLGNTVSYICSTPLWKPIKQQRL